MKFAFAFLLSFATTTSAFTGPIVSRQTTVLQAAVRPDTSKIIQEALAKSKQFGPTSTEARLAWEAVEEMDASTNQFDAMSVPSAQDECDVDATSAACIEYGTKIDELRQILEDTGPLTNKIRNIALEVKAIKMQPVEMPVGADTPAVRAALKAATAATAEFGADSVEAKLAWESLEEISSASEAAGALGGTLTDECLTEMIEACEALEEIQRAIDVVNAIESGPK
ncbi:CP12 domain [Fragilaria crotonensis]|nr:CP12 domain [Fragilaria crotonensis]